MANIFINSVDSAVMGDYWAEQVTCLPTNRSARFWVGLSVSNGSSKRSSLIEISHAAFQKGGKLPTKWPMRKGLISSYSLKVRSERNIMRERVRIAKKHRVTKRNQCELELIWTRQGKYKFSTDAATFSTTLLETFSRHSLIDLKVQAAAIPTSMPTIWWKDIGLTLVMALFDALGNKKGIQRYGVFCWPDADRRAKSSPITTDNSRPPVDTYLYSSIQPSVYTYCVPRHYMAALSSAHRSMRKRLPIAHIKLFEGKEQPSMSESMSKLLAKALSMAVAKDKRYKGIPSTKGVL